MDAGGFHRFNEAGREANGDAVFHPVLLTLSRLKANDPRFSDRLTSDLGEKFVTRFVIRQELAAEDQTVTNTMLEWYLPLPSSTMRDRSCVGDRRFNGGCLHGDRSIAG